VVNRRGASAMGCLIPLLAIALVLYFGREFGFAYFRYYQFTDAMKQEARFGTMRSDDSITAHLRSLADSLDLPRNAGQIRISRSSGDVVIWSDYEETIVLPFNHEKTVSFHPSGGKTP
jgi:hypothetical protein